MEFLQKYLYWIIGALIVIVFVYQAGKALRKAKKIDAEGLETDAVVSRVEEHTDPDTAGATFVTYVRYTDDEGRYRESPMAYTPDAPYREGQKLRIRFLPGDYKLVRHAEDGEPAK